MPAERDTNQKGGTKNLISSFKDKWASRLNGITWRQLEILFRRPGNAGLGAGQSGLTAPPPPEMYQLLSRLWIKKTFFMDKNSFLFVFFSA